ncbi:hypothetical protein TTHERM_01402780 (macronuclear) [Tetrahymena thermophila SB210]|uniref:Uncharacterized protein n=1 Tax=Tetrahymena thermophila (strain SB210) TaxID=312017 RepID=Q24H88_TETTS|nr:hypothetical protein TTHERM_01402780 [Tetrahymena thermophila SB210]EAS07137.2 hypothetical protein TTHERM_01402780 [Tetrahymena thermophila SB210]|eukprot:XP_001027379.2 hypothetical protein TTHERM_01402780 [Tetrahymena thermophila SB210]
MENLIKMYEIDSNIFESEYIMQSKCQFQYENSEQEVIEKMQTNYVNPKLDSGNNQLILLRNQNMNIKISTTYLLQRKVYITY